MKELLEELVNNGMLEAFDDENEFHLPFLLSGVALVRKGALSAGAGVLGSVSTWGKPEIDLLRSTVKPTRLLNVVAEDFHGCFGKPMHNRPAGLAWGAILGDLVSCVEKFHEEAPEFITRVVGLRYEERLDRIESLRPGQPVSLLWEPLNPYDSKAIKVSDAHGEDLGYLRKGVAHKLVARIKKGAALSARVVVVLGEEFDVNDRLNIEVKVWDNTCTHESAVQAVY